MSKYISHNDIAMIRDVHEHQNMPAYQIAQRYQIEYNIGGM